MTAQSSEEQSISPNAEGVSAGNAGLDEPLQTPPGSDEGLIEELKAGREFVPASHPASKIDYVLGLQASLLRVTEERDDAEKDVHELTKALTGLTCGGSEFFVRKRGRYIADIPACRDYVDRRTRSQHDEILSQNAARRKAEASLSALRGEVGNFCERATRKGGLGPDVHGWIDALRERAGTP